MVSNSREVDIYDKARQKLQDIASTLVEPDQLEQLFARVMSLVPPDELQDVMVRRPLGPLDGSEISALSKLVTEQPHRGALTEEPSPSSQLTELELAGSNAT